MATNNSANDKDANFVVYNGTGTYFGRTLTPGTGISITNGTGISGNPVIATTSTIVPGVANLGIKLSGGVFTVTSSTGAALSASNPAYVTLNSNVTPGTLIQYTITADTTFQDNNSGASTIAGAFFGVSMQNTVTYNLDMPFFLYAVSQTTDASCVFMISRYPNTYISPVTAKIGKTGSTAAASTQGSFFSLGNPTVANYQQSSCMCIGSFRMQSTARATAGVGGPPDWKVQTLSFQDGIGQFKEQTEFSIPAACFGAASSKYFYDNGGTAPGFTFNTLIYQVLRNNTFLFTAVFTTCNVNGAGTVSTWLATPFTAGASVCGIGYVYKTSAVPSTGICWVQNDPTQGVNNKFTLAYTSTTSGYPVVNHSNIASNLNDNVGYNGTVLINFS